MLITPAIASEPYCADAPSRRTSIRLMAEIGMAFKSALGLPRPVVPCECTSELLWRRLPLTSTQVWSGDKPRNEAGRTASEPSVMDDVGKLKLGTAYCRAFAVSVNPPAARSSAEMISTGAEPSVAVRTLKREPTT